MPGQQSVTVATAMKTYVVLQTSDGLVYQQPVDGSAGLMALLTSASTNPPHKWWLEGFLPRTPD